MNYGRLKSIPSFTLSNVTPKIRQVIFHFIKEQTGLRFVEWKMKNGFTVIVKSLIELLFNKENFFSSTDNHWNDTIQEFKILESYHFWKAGKATN